MAATNGSRHKDIWSPVVEDDENSEEKNETLDLTAPKTLMNPFMHPLQMPLFPFPPNFQFGPFGFTRMPLIMPPQLNQALFAALCSKSFQRLPQVPFTRVPEPIKKLVLKPAACPPSTKTQTQTQNPIVNEILKDSSSSLSSEHQQNSINHNICAVCGEGFRLTGDLVHHMRRERCHWTPSKSASENATAAATPYQVPKTRK